MAKATKELETLGESPELAGSPRLDEEDDAHFLDRREREERGDQNDRLSISARAARRKGENQKAVVFFSRFRNDELLLEETEQRQVGPNKYTTIPSKWIRFQDRMYVTSDPKHMEFIRNHPRYGIELLEFGKKEHEHRIKLYDDSGRARKLAELDRLGKASEKRFRQGIDDG